MRVGILTAVVFDSLAVNLVLYISHRSTTVAQRTADERRISSLLVITRIRWRLVFVHM